MSAEYEECKAGAMDEARKVQSPSGYTPPNIGGIVTAIGQSLIARQNRIKAAKEYARRCLFAKGYTVKLLTDEQREALKKVPQDKRFEADFILAGTDRVPSYPESSPSK